MNLLMLDKTGTITLGNRQATAFIPMPGTEERELADVAQAASLADETPEGRSIVILAKRYGVRERELADAGARFVPFSAQTRMSGVNLRGQELRKGAGDAIIDYVHSRAGQVPPELTGSSAHRRRGGNAARRLPRRHRARRDRPARHPQGGDQRAALRSCAGWAS